MKKVIFGTALASMALLSACSSDNELANVETSANNAIGFHVVGNKAETRATIIDNNNITKTDFKVYAFTADKGEAYMGSNDEGMGWNGINIKHDGTKWDYAQSSDLRYWPESTPLNFYAVNPGTFEDNSFAAGMQGNCQWTIAHDKQQISYMGTDTYNTEHKNPANIDLMYAIAKGKTYSNTSGIVQMQFRHILSQVVFKAKTKYDDMDVEINGMKFHNFQLSGIFTFPEEEATAPTRTDWTQTGAVMGAKTVGMNTDKIQITKKDVATDISTNKPLLFIPQELKAWKTSTTSAKAKIDADTDKESYLEISCRIKQKGEYVFGKDGFKTLYVPFGAIWEPGKRYIYTLIFGGGYDDQGNPILMPINFNAVTSDWVDGTDSGINM